ncbi:MAG TPA: GNAT family N-acetyltransferase [Pyrinomonadaceae bacterium]|nr:GNAT family N-acetyltransferase [Pyrinomonadaceae bacterium]
MASPAYKLDTAFLSQPDVAPDVMAATLMTPKVISPAPGTEEHILSALSPGSLTNVIMSGFIRDNGFVNPLNRGEFFACRDERNELEGIALIGHTVLFEAFSDRAIQTFAALARRHNSTHLLMGEHKAVARFWNYYAQDQDSPRLVCPVVFLQRREPFAAQTDVAGLRLATREDLEQVVQTQAAMALEISGVNPLEKDPAGFRARYLRRIEKKRVWVVIENGRLVFKTDVIADTPQATYIEGVYVTPEDRGKGLGRRYLTALGRRIMDRGKAIYLFVEDQNIRTQSFYLQLGFTAAGQYDLLYF